jgi:transposase
VPKTLVFGTRPLPLAPPFHALLALFVGDVAAGKSLAGLYSLVATCEARGINPFDYLVDVLARVQDHPASAVDELLPGAWAAAD